MPKKAEALKRLLAAGKKVSDQAQRSFLRAEDILTELEDREGRRAEREGRRS